MQISREAYRRITGFALVALAVIIVSGAAVRLTGSGLGCSDWPTCEESRFHPETDNVHGLVEFGNRLFTGVVSLAVIAAVLGSMRRVPRRADLTRWSWGLVAGVLAQIVIGAFVVRLELIPGIVIAHFLVSMVLIWNAVVLHHRAALPDAFQGVRHQPFQLAWQARAVSALATAVLVAGTVVTGGGPHAGDEGAERLNVDLRWAVRVHSAFVWLLLAAVVSFVLSLRRASDRPDLWRPLTVLLAVLCGQGAIGYVQYFTDVPALLVGIHVAGATLVWIAVLRLHLLVGTPLPARSNASRAPEPVGAST